MNRYTADDLTRITATPATLGRHLGKDFLGRAYRPYPWLLDMERHILAMLFRPGNEVMVISVPPQSGKSQYCAVWLPFWWLGRHPHEMVLNVSYSEERAAENGDQVLRLMKRYGMELFGVGVDPMSDSKSNWKTDNGIGGMKSAGILSGITGTPGITLVVCDDVLAGDVQANSPIIKERNVAEWDNSIANRFQEHTKALVIATRWADDDLSGEILDRAAQPGYEGYPVTYLNYKAIAEPDPDEIKYMTDEELEAWRDIMGRRYGEPLGGQHSLEFFLRKKASTPIGRWMSLHQGTPSFSAAGMFPIDAWGYWVHDDVYELVPGDVRLPEMVKQVRVWDIASSPGGGDWTVGTKVGRSADGRFFILDRERFRLAPGGVEERILQIAEADGYQVPIRIEQERAGAGITVVDTYKRLLLGYDVDGVKAEGDKESRATPASIEQNKGNVFLPRHAWWVQEWTKEHSQMDGKGKRPKHDDQIDTFAYAMRFLIQSGESAVWDINQLSARNGATLEEQMEILLVRQALGLQ